MQVWHTSDKKEHAARTIRPKIHKKMPTFLEQFPDLPELPAWEGEPPSIDWDNVIAEATSRGMPCHLFAQGSQAPSTVRSVHTWHSRRILCRLILP